MVKRQQDWNSTMNNIDNNSLPESEHFKIMYKFLKKKQNPNILEFGVERGSSTKMFLDFTEKYNGKVFSVDIEDCKNVSSSPNWRFLQSDDLLIENVLKNFPEIKNNGADLIYIDSYHENFHVQKLLSLYFKYVKKDGAIFVDDLDSFPLRQQRDLWNSIVYDLTLESVKEFYYNNTKKTSFCVYYNDNENGLGMFKKNSELFDEPNEVKTIWNYNFLIKAFYPYLRKFTKIIKSILKFKK